MVCCLYSSCLFTAGYAGKVLAALIHKLAPSPLNDGLSGRRVLDCACGIGTQSIGLAQQGFQVTATDISAAAITRARTESQRRGLLHTCAGDARGSGLGSGSGSGSGSGAGAGAGSGSGSDSGSGPEAGAEAGAGADPVKGVVDTTAEKGGIVATGVADFRFLPSQLREQGLLQSPMAAPLVVFLDVDGVLASKRCITLEYSEGDATLVEDASDKCFPLEVRCIDELKRVVDATKARIVVSSTWRQHAHMREFLLAALETRGIAREAVIGDTPVVPAGTRGDEIARWLHDHPSVRRYVVLEDSADHVHSIEAVLGAGRVVKTLLNADDSAVTGLTTACADKALAILQAGGDATSGQGAWPVVIAMDNALPHLLSDDDIAQALLSMKECLLPGGLLLLSVRDYAEMVKYVQLLRRSAGVVL